METETIVLLWFVSFIGCVILAELLLRCAYIFVKELHCDLCERRAFCPDAGTPRVMTPLLPDKANIPNGRS